MSRPASERQQNFIASLLSERLVTLGLPDMAVARKATDLDNLSGDQAKTLINRLLAMPKDPDPDMPEVVAMATRNGKGNRPGECFTCGHMVEQDQGFYFLDGEGRWGVHHKVGQCDHTPVVEPVGIDLSGVPGGLYAVPGGDTRLKVKIDKPDKGKWAGWVFVKDGAEYGYGNRLGKVKPGGTYVGGAMDAIAIIAADPMAAAAAYGHLTNTCGVCGRKLEDPESVARGIGPVCMEKFA